MKSLETHVQKRYRRLYTFLGSYLYQSWPEDYPSPDKAFDEFLADSRSGELRSFVEDCGGLLALDDQALVNAFDELSTNFSPRTDYGWNEREWLTSLRARAVAELGRRGKTSEE